MHLGLWDRKARPPTKATGAPEIPQYSIDYSDSQLLVSDNWLYVDPEYPEAYSFDLPVEGLKVEREVLDTPA